VENIYSSQKKKYSVLGVKQVAVVVAAVVVVVVVAVVAVVAADAHRQSNQLIREQYLQNPEEKYSLAYIHPHKNVEMI